MDVVLWLKDRYLIDRGIESETIGISIPDEADDVTEELSTEADGVTEKLNTEADGEKESNSEAFKKMNKRQKAEYIFIFLYLDIYVDCGIIIEEF